MSRHPKGFAAWLALLAVALQALWPLLAQAQPKVVLAESICSTNGADHGLEIPGPFDGHGPANHIKHCPLCNPAGDRAAQAVDAPALSAFFIASVVFEAPAAPPATPYCSPVVSPARPRAPPARS